VGECVGHICNGTWMGEEKRKEGEGTHASY
jgi:hypothetical protein